MPDIYSELKAATPEELLDVAKNFYLYSPSSYDSAGNFIGNPEYLMDIAFKIGKGDGWGCIAPDWLTEYQEQVKQAAEEKVVDRQGYPPCTTHPTVPWEAPKNPRIMGITAEPLEKGAVCGVDPASGRIYAIRADGKKGEWEENPI